MSSLVRAVGRVGKAKRCLGYASALNVHPSRSPVVSLTSGKVERETRKGDSKCEL